MKHSLLLLMCLTLSLCFLKVPLLKKPNQNNSHKTPPHKNLPFNEVRQLDPLPLASPSLACHSKLNDLTVVTTLNSNYFLSETNQLVHSAAHHLSCNIYVYHENSQDEKKMRKPLLLEAFPSQSCATFHLLDLFIEVPWLLEFTEGSDNIFSHVLKNPKGHYAEKKWNLKAKYIFRKVAAVWHAVSVDRSRYLLWLDTDVQIQKPLDAEFWNFVSKYDIVFIDAWKPPKQEMAVFGKRINHQVDTGVVFYVVNSKTKGFINNMVHTYLSNSAVDLPYLDDTFVFTQVLERNQNLVKGFFSVCAHALHEKLKLKKILRPWEKLMKLYSPAGFRYKCTGDVDASPFNMFEYLAHLKGRKKHGNLHRGQQLRSQQKIT
mmetsp:Transcript_17287/g.55439  ORF Transcript_17287/g.55439 Transcript_17287/m.55439 type:complete len:375 (+) Transcript_17287:260-1384(+)